MFKTFVDLSNQLNVYSAYLFLHPYFKDETGDICR